MAIKQLVSFNRALSHLRVEAGDDDDTIKDLIDAASDIVRSSDSAWRMVTCRAIIAYA